MYEIIVAIGWYLLGIISFIIILGVVQEELTIGNIAFSLLSGILGPLIVILWLTLEMVEWCRLHKFVIPWDKVIWRKKR